MKQISPKEATQTETRAQARAQRQAPATQPPQQPQQSHKATAPILPVSREGPQSSRSRCEDALQRANEQAQFYRQQKAGILRTGVQDLHYE